MVRLAVCTMVVRSADSLLFSFTSPPPLTVATLVRLLGALPATFTVTVRFQ